MEINTTIEILTLIVASLGVGVTIWVYLRGKRDEKEKNNGNKRKLILVLNTELDQLTAFLNRTPTLNNGVGYVIGTGTIEELGPQRELFGNNADLHKALNNLRVTIERIRYDFDLVKTFANASLSETGKAKQDYMDMHNPNGRSEIEIVKGLLEKELAKINESSRI